VSYYGRWLKKKYFVFLWIFSISISNSINEMNYAQFVFLLSHKHTSWQGKKNKKAAQTVYSSRNTGLFFLKISLNKNQR
jgi:hypothetical protein